MLHVSRCFFQRQIPEFGPWTSSRCWPLVAQVRLLGRGERGRKTPDLDLRRPRYPGYPRVPWVTQLRVAGGANGTMVSHENLWETIAAWWFGTMEYMTFHILGISSSHLTHIFQDGLKPPTSIGYIGYPQLYMIYYILNSLGGMHMQAARNELQMIDVPYTLWLFNIAMENGPFIDGLPIKKSDFP